jgi:hypothetical protein
MRRVLPLLLAALAVPASAAAVRDRPAAPVRSAIFFYPWYSNPAHDGAYAHWQQGDHRPPFDVASDYFPARGAYSSGDPRILAAQMADIARAGIDEVVSSWWGPGSEEDLRLPAVLRAAAHRGLRVAVHLEPYGGRTLDTIASDLQRFKALGVRDVYVYRAEDFAASQWRSLDLRHTGLRVFAQTNHVGFAARAGFRGFYTYDILLYGGGKFRRLCAQAHAAGILCGPSVGPGYDAERATGDPRVKFRLEGETYDSMWRAALRAHADLVTITSYNEWSEGTQIEPAGHGGGYESYNGAYGLRGIAAQDAYLRATARWTSRFGR